MAPVDARIELVAKGMFYRRGRTHPNATWDSVLDDHRKLYIGLAVAALTALDTADWSVPEDEVFE